MNEGVMGLVDGEYPFLDRQMDAVRFRVMPVGRPWNSGSVDFLIHPAED